MISSKYSKDTIVRSLEKSNILLRTNIHNEKKVVQRNLNGEIIKQFNSVKSASDATGISRPNISNCCLGKRKTTGGYKWEYII